MSEHLHRLVEDMTVGEEICTTCGLVTKEKLFNYRPKPCWLEKDVETHEADPTTGLDIARHDWGIGSTFDVPRSHTHREQWERLRHLHHQLSASPARCLRDAMIDIDKFCDRLALPKSVQREMAYLYRKLKKLRLTAGRDRRAVIAAIASIACARMGVQRPNEEFARGKIGFTNWSLAGFTNSEKVGQSSTTTAQYTNTASQLKKINFVESWKRFWR